jgi:hypothetical protein
LLLFSGCASTSFSSPESRTIPEDFIGISPDRTGLDQKYIDKLDELGASWIRVAAGWESMEKAEGVWDFSRWDQYLDRAEAAGKKVVFVLCYDNPWLYKDHREHRDFTEREIPYFLKYVEQVVNRYRGRIGAFEIWNEPNALFWDGPGKRFYPVAAAAAKKVKELDPDVPVLAGSMFRASSGFIRGMFRSGAFDNVDGISFHPYSSDPIHTVKQIDKLKKIMGEFNSALPVWITEVGYATEGIYFSSCNLENYPEYILKTLSGLAVRGTRNAILYELMDEYNPGNTRDFWNPGQFFGLIYPNGDLKNGAEAFKLWSRYIPKSEYLPELPRREDVPSFITSLYFKNGDENILLIWYDSKIKNSSKKLFLRIPGVSSLIRHDIISGEAEELLSAGDPVEAETVLLITRNPAFITWKTEEYSGVPVLSGNR